MSIPESHPATNLTFISTLTPESKVNHLRTTELTFFVTGTNKVAHYYVLVDENGFGSDGLQLFSYWMCFLYCRCTRSVSYAPPAYYAYLAAQHGRYLINFPEGAAEGGKNSIFHADLNQNMFFV